MLTVALAIEIAVLIMQNENKAIAELSDTQIGYYLVDRNIDETPENIALVRSV